MGACGCQKCVQVESEQHEEGLFGYSELIQQPVAGRSTIEDIEAFLLKFPNTCLITDDFPTFHARLLSLDRVFPHAALSRKDLPSIPSDVG